MLDFDEVTVNGQRPWLDLRQVRFPTDALNIQPPFTYVGYYERHSIFKIGCVYLYRAMMYCDYHNFPKAHATTLSSGYKRERTTWLWKKEEVKC